MAACWSPWRVEQRKGTQPTRLWEALSTGGLRLHGEITNSPSEKGLGNGFSGAEQAGSVTCYSRISMGTGSGQGWETRVTRPCWSFPGAWFQSHPTDLSEEPRPVADSNDAEGPAISICLEFLTTAASGMVVSHSTLISPASVTAAMTILDLPAISPAKQCEVGPRGLAALP